MRFSDSALKRSQNQKITYHNLNEISIIPGRQTRITTEEDGTKVSFHDSKTGELLAQHLVATGVGHLVRLPKNADRFRDTDYSIVKYQVLTAFSGLEPAKNYIEQLIEKYPRYARDQLRIMQRCTEQYNGDELKKALEYCEEHDLISANDFRDTLVFFRSDEPKIVPKLVLLPEKYQAVKPKTRSLLAYTNCNGQKSAVLFCPLQAAGQAEARQESAGCTPETVTEGGGY